MSKAIRNIKTITGRDNKPINIIIPAAILDSKNKNFGPQSLVKLQKNLTILDYQVRIIREQFTQANIILVSGYDHVNVLNNSPENIIHIENPLFETTNIVKNITIGLKACTTDRVLIIYGNLIFNRAIVKYKFDKQSLIFLDSTKETTEDDVGCSINDGYIEHILYDLPNKLTQIIYLTGKELELYKKLVYTTNIDTMLDFEIINNIIKNNGQFLAVQNENIRTFNITSYKQVARIQDILEENICQ